MRILCLFIRHGTNQHAGALESLDAWYRQQGLLDRRTLWIIDNALPADQSPLSLGPGVWLRPGDNRAWEFSAWERGLREAAASPERPDVVHFVTSAFNTLYTRYLEHFHPDMPDFVVRRRICLGHIDSYDRPVAFAHHSSRAWIRTCFFFLPFRTACQLNPWVSFDNPALVFSSAESTQFKTGAPLSVDYQQRIRIWLEGRDVGGHEWHSPIGTGPDEVARFQRKTLAILNEHSLAATMRSAGLRLVDFCWLYTMWQQSPGRIPEIPAEQDQLGLRRRVLGIPEPAGD